MAIRSSPDTPRGPIPPRSWRCCAGCARGWASRWSPRTSTTACVPAAKSTATSSTRVRPRAVCRFRCAWAPGRRAGSPFGAARRRPPAPLATVSWRALPASAAPTGSRWGTRPMTGRRPCSCGRCRERESPASAACGHGAAGSSARSKQCGVTICGHGCMGKGCHSAATRRTATRDSPATACATCWATSNAGSRGQRRAWPRWGGRPSRPRPSSRRRRRSGCPGGGPLSASHCRGMSSGPLRRRCRWRRSSRATICCCAARVRVACRADS